MYVLGWMAPRYRSCIRRSRARRVIVRPPSQAAFVMSPRDVHKYVGVCTHGICPMVFFLYLRKDMIRRSRSLDRVTKA